MLNTVTPFGLNSACEFAYKKAERIAIAIHLITNFIPSEELVRLHLRDKSIELLSDIIALREGFRTSGPERVNDVVSLLTEVVTLLEISNASGYVSRMNVELLSSECRSLAVFLREHEDTKHAESMQLNASYFPDRPRREQGHSLSRSYKGQKAIKDKTSSPNREQREVHAKRSERKELLLSLVREKGRLSVKEAAAVIQGCSEKTLQRELMSLVAEGLIAREGERRWSTYVPSAN